VKEAHSQFSQSLPAASQPNTAQAEDPKKKKDSKGAKKEDKKDEDPLQKLLQ
jgi:ribosomal protein L12E/L44/L45/RPP1/RPP2